ncbi:hypothetical protein DH2020_002189 [Rehmannia glutinosa]|uniref:Ripening-related protein n=1 Tax=Rehmannia glutinosa TaxID=99300 RepID=A0ABR0XSZ2_REHGL
MKNLRKGAILVLLVILATQSLEARLQSCKPSGKIRGKKPPPGQCNQENDSDCCQSGKFYTTYKCSPPVSGHTKAVLTINSFEKGGDGGGPSECDNNYHSDDTPVVALSTGWYSGGSRCLNNVTISANGQSVTAMVVDECDSTMGCDDDHDYQPPCPNNIVDASKAVKMVGSVECDNQYHSDDTPIVALSTGWFNKMNRCFKNITIYGNGNSVSAMVVDECDSKMGCDKEHDYQPPCDNNIVDASRAVWEALGVPEKDRGLMDIYWSDA